MALERLGGLAILSIEKNILIKLESKNLREFYKKKKL